MGMLVTIHNLLSWTSGNNASAVCTMLGDYRLSWWLLLYWCIYGTSEKKIVFFMHRFMGSATVRDAENLYYVIYAIGHVCTNW